MGCWPPYQSRPNPWQRDPILSQLLIRHLLTDPAGYQCIATDEGVFRYDGYELVPLTRLTCPGRVAAPRGMVSTLCLDPAGLLWIGADAGLFCLTLRTGALRRVALSADARTAPPTVIQLFRHPRAAHLWVSCGDDSTVVLDAAHGGRLLSRRLLPGVGFQFQADGTAAGVWISFAETRYFDPTRHQERIGSPGLARVGPTGAVRQYVPTSFVVLPLPGTTPLRVFSANTLYEVTADNQLREIRRWLTAYFADNFLSAAVRSDSALQVGLAAPLRTDDRARPARGCSHHRHGTPGRNVRLLPAFCGRVPRRPRGAVALFAGLAGGVQAPHGRPPGGAAPDEGQRPSGAEYARYHAAGRWTALAGDV